MLNNYGGEISERKKRYSESVVDQLRVIVQVGQYSEMSLLKAEEQWCDCVRFDLSGALCEVHLRR